jgi:hypothetical protein
MRISAKYYVNISNFRMKFENFYLQPDISKFEFRFYFVVTEYPFLREAQ